MQCVELNETMEQAEGDLDVYQHLPISVYAQGDCIGLLVAVIVLVASELDNVPRHGRGATNVVEAPRSRSSLCTDL